MIRIKCFHRRLIIIIDYPGRVHWSQANPERKKADKKKTEHSFPIASF